ncbi:MAG: C39 family peptidase [Patescibacteria group bacterium]|jgi:hypothetical protein
MKKYIFVIIIIVILSGVWKIYEVRHPRSIKVDMPIAKEHQEFVDKNIDVDLFMEEIIKEDEILPQEEVEVPVPEVPVIPVKPEINSINLAVPFTSQAPTANWDQPFQDACEEASLLMVDYYYQNKNMPSKEAVENIFIDMVAWQEKFMEGNYDITIEETGQLAKGYFGYNVSVIPNLTATKIRNLLREGFPVIVPANGHILINPNFTGDGPKYHMLVIKGFVDDKFITNDPGTRNGADFVYTETNLMEAIADWDKEKALTVGPKNALILLEN